MNLPTDSVCVQMGATHSHREEMIRHSQFKRWSVFGHMTSQAVLAI